jgi:ACS family glucarate transporter-like MFS transporter
MTFAVLLCFVGYLLRINLSIAGPTMIKDLGLSAVQLGLVFSVFSWAYALFQVPGGLYGTVVGARRAMTRLTLCWGAITLVTGLVPGNSIAPPWLVLGALVGIRGILGITQAALFPVIQGPVLVHWLPTNRWAVASGLVNVGLTLGGAAAGPLIAWLVASVGWRQSFALSAPIAFALAAGWWWTYRDDPDQHPSVNQEELTLIRAGRSGQPGAVDWRRHVREVFANRDILLLTVSYGLVNYLSAFFYNWFYFYLVEVRHVSAQLGGDLNGALWIVGAAAAIGGGLLCDWLTVRIGSRSSCRLMAGVGVLSIAPLMVLGATARTPIAVVAILSAAFGLIQLTDAVFWVAAMRVAGTRTAAATGLMNSGANVAIGVGSLLIPVIARAFGWGTAVASGALLAIASAGCWLWIAADRAMVEPVAEPPLVTA